jgi:hypothetical protein
MCTHPNQFQTRRNRKLPNQNQRERSSKRVASESNLRLSKSLVERRDSGWWLRLLLLHHTMSAWCDSPILQTSSSRALMDPDDLLVRCFFLSTPTFFPAFALFSDNVLRHWGATTQQQLTSQSFNFKAFCDIRQDGNGNASSALH